jgi:aldehyde reductase
MAMRYVTLPDGERVPAFGLGTWCLGDDPQAREGELAALRSGLDAGATLVATCTCCTGAATCR